MIAAPTPSPPFPPAAPLPPAAPPAPAPALPVAAPAPAALAAFERTLLPQDIARHDAAAHLLRTPDPKAPLVASPGPSGPQVPVGTAPQELLREVAAQLRRSGVEPGTLFKSLDTSGSGRLSAQDLATMALTFWPELSQADLNDLFRTVARNGNGFIEIGEFCAALGFDDRSAMSTMRIIQSLAQLDGALQIVVDRIRNSIVEADVAVDEVFRRLDKASLGYLRHEDISRMAFTFDEQLTGHQLDTLFRHFDPRGCGIVDLESFKRCLGFLVSAEDAGRPLDQAVMARIAQAAKTLQSRGYGVQDAFLLFDTNRNGFLDLNEFYRLLLTCDARVSQRESDAVFAQVSGPSGRVDMQQFAKAFSLDASGLTAMRPAAPRPQVEPRYQSQLAQVQGWLEPALLAQDLALSGRDRMSRADFDRLVLAMEPQLGAPELERIWRLSGASPDVGLAELVQRFQSEALLSGSDPWAEAALRRIVSRLGPALSSPGDLFRRFNLSGSGGLSSAEFERMLLTQDPRMSREEVNALWRLADRDGNGYIDLYEFVGVLRRAQLEVAKSAAPAQAPPGFSDRQRILEAHVTQLERRLRERGVTLLRACELLDTSASGLLDRSALRRILQGAGMDFADWEQEELILRCDTTASGMLNYRELIRQFNFEAQAKAIRGWQQAPIPAPSAPGYPSAPAAPAAPGPSPKEKAVADRIDQLRARLKDSGLTLAQGFAYFDPSTSGYLDRAGFMRMLDWAQVSMQAWEQDALFERCSGGRPGLLNYNDVVNQFDVSKQAAAAKVAALASWWYQHSTNLAELFRMFDADGNGLLEKAELGLLLQTADPSMTEGMSNQIFELSASGGRVGFQEFSKSFGISADSLAPPTPAAAPAAWLAGPDPNSFAAQALQSPAVQALVSRIQTWLEPALLAKSVGVESLGGGSRGGRLSKGDFDRLCLGVDPGLQERELLRLFGQARASQASPARALPEEIEVAAFLRHFGPESPEPPRGHGQDQWAMAMLRRIARVASSALAGPEQAFRKFDLDGSGTLSSLEFERFLRVQEPSLTQNDVEWLWRLADSDNDGQITLNEFSVAVQQLQIEAARVQGHQASVAGHQVIEVKMALLARMLHQRSFSLEKALAVYDRDRSGFLDKASFKQLLGAMQFKLAEWEVDEVIGQCDTACDGRLDSRELLRRLGISLGVPQPPGAPLPPAAPGAPAAPVAPGAPRPPGAPGAPKVPGAPPGPAAPGPPGPPRAPGAPLPPAAPGAPKVPGAPPGPGAPGPPGPPRAPGAPLPPAAPGAPKVPGAPPGPAAPGPPGPPRAPGAPLPPAAPGAPKVPGVPPGPGAPGPPGPPRAPGAPTAPGAPRPLGAPAAPGAPRVPGAPPPPGAAAAPGPPRAPGAPLPPAAPGAPPKVPGAPPGPAAPGPPRPPGAPLAPAAPGAPRPPGAPGAPGPPAAPGAPRAPGAPLPHGAPAAPGAPRPPGPPLSPGAPRPPISPSSPASPRTPGPPGAPRPPGAPGAPPGPAAPGAPRAPGAPAAPCAPKAPSSLLSSRPQTSPAPPAAPSPPRGLSAPGAPKAPSSSSSSRPLTSPAPPAAPGAPRAPGLGGSSSSSRPGPPGPPGAPGRPAPPAGPGRPTAPGAPAAPAAPGLPGSGPLSPSRSSAPAPPGRGFGSPTTSPPAAPGVRTPGPPGAPGRPLGAPPGAPPAAPGRPLGAPPGRPGAGLSRPGAFR
eukprot:TRINITY_DN6647_c0_g1_i1.p1 TRINITY_DN6647_c0_g1~~TRINITY_DN6647_c0_g1_i1.p1  ORF type:complete len:1707 (-),score=326.05 TRINITY_DN6647_c0_g1_i1:36-5156(-)